MAPLIVLRKRVPSRMPGGAAQVTTLRRIWVPWEMAEQSRLADPEIARRPRLLRNYGSERKYVHGVIGVNS